MAVNGWNNFGSLVAANCCARRGIPMVVMSESARQDEPRTCWKELIKRRVANLYSAALVGGQRHVEYLVELGMPRERVFTGYDVVDNSYFRQKAEEVGGRKSEVRKQYQLPENYFLASARFIEKKNLPRLIRAYAEYRRLCRASAPRRSAQGTAIRPRQGSADRSPGRSCWAMGRCGELSTLNSQLSTCTTTCTFLVSSRIMSCRFTTHWPRPSSIPVPVSNGAWL